MRLCCLLLLSFSLLLVSSIASHLSPERSPRSTSSTKRSTKTGGCITSNGIHIPSKQSSLFALSPAPSPPVSSLDICFIISSSKSMPHRWIQVLSERLDELLRAQGIGSNATNQNHFSIVQFGGRGSDIRPSLVRNALFPLSEIVSARKNIKRNGFVGDGFEALKFALEKVPFRDSPFVKKAFIFGANSGRSILADTHGLTLPLLSDLIGRSGASLDVVANLTLYPSNREEVPIGFYNRSATVFKSGSGYVASNLPVGVASSHGDTLSSYVNLSLSVGGGVWSLGVVKDAEVDLMSSVASAMVDGWSLRDRRVCLECTCSDGVGGACGAAINQRKCKSCLSDDKKCLSNDTSLSVLKASVSISYPDKGHNIATIKISSNTDGDMSYRYLHFNSTSPTLQYTLSPLMLRNLSHGIHTVLLVGKTSGGVETAKLVQFEIKEVPFDVMFLPTSVDPHGVLTIPFKSTWINNVYCSCKIPGTRPFECSKYRASPYILGPGSHSLTVRCYYEPQALSVAKVFNFNLKPAPKMPSSVLRCSLSLSRGAVPYTVTVGINCNRNAVTNCSIANLPSHQCNGSYTFSTSSLSPGYHPFRLEAHDQYGYTYSTVSLFNVEPIDRRCCPKILRNSARVHVVPTNNSSSSSTVVRIVSFVADLSNGNCSLTEGFSYKMSWSPQNVLSGSVPIHHSPLSFSTTFIDKGSHALSFKYCNNPATPTNVCCDHISLPFTIS